MIPVHISITGFLSYRDSVEIDFTTFDLACIAGPNGAGKSSLLDAITWVLFGQARKRDDSVINAQSAAAEVSLVFAYESNLYRVQRVKPRDKTMLLEFHILQGDAGAFTTSDLQATALQRLSAGVWKPLTERTLRETELRILQTLRLDYDTFVNASFFLQGKADQFTQQRPSDRKRILGNILGLEIWDVYKEQAAARRRSVEADIDSLDGRLQEIIAELAQEAERRSRVQALQGEMERVIQERAAQEALVANIRQVAATLEEQQRLVDALARQLDLANRRLNESNIRLEDRTQERAAYTEILVRTQEIETAYASWQAARAELARLDEVASQFREHEKRREAPRTEIQAERARLEQEMLTLLGQQQAVNAAQSQIEALHSQSTAVQTDLSAAEARLEQRAQLDGSLQEVRQKQSDLRAENTRLKPEMDELKARIRQLEETEGATCPLCGQPLSPPERQNLIEALNLQGREMGDRYRANQALLQEVDASTTDLENQIAALAQAETEARAHAQALAELSSQLRMLQEQQSQWQENGVPRLAGISDLIEHETYAPEPRARLTQIDAELKAIGYDAAAHDAVRQQELDGRASQEDLLTLEKARAALAPLEREIADLQKQIADQRSEVEHQQEEHHSAATALEAARQHAPDLYTAELILFDLQERENRLRLDLGAAQQRLLVLDDLKTRRKSFEAQREEIAVQVRQYKQLERAFGKDCVPALLIEQVLPEIEGRANELLDRLSGGGMSVRFATQAQYKDKRREDMKETLDIILSDSAGSRDYEMFSGGEAFRANFAIRLALSEVLSQRAGARLQTLVIDEGFGSQDAQGRQRLIEAINLVRPDFAKILVITHIEELKEAFPTRIEVEKTERGSTVQVI
jgi:exonuclease SbcC